MKRTRVRCACGHVSTLTEFVLASGYRCSACGAMLQSGEPGVQFADETDTDAPAKKYIDDADDGVPYRLEGEPVAASTSPPQATWVPVQGSSIPAAISPRSTLRGSPAHDHWHVDLPGPFFRWSALAYPFLHPTWMRWLGLSFMTLLCVAVISITVFTSWVIITMGAFVSVLAIGSMAMVCLALASFVVASFVVVIEDTASGDERLQQLVDFDWWDILPRFMQVLGAAAVTMAIVYGVTLPLKRWFPADSPGVIVVQALLIHQLFPIFLFTNLADSSWVPIWSLGLTLQRLASAVGKFVLFLAITGLVAVLADAALSALYRWHVAAGIGGSGPILAAWLMFYGHWLGRLGRQLAGRDE